MEKTIRSRAIAGLGALAMLAIPVAGMGATAWAADPTTGGITLNATEGNTLDGHTFTAYKLGDYGDIAKSADGKTVDTLTVTQANAKAGAWVAAANKTAGVTDLTGYDDVGDLAHTGYSADATSATQQTMREEAKTLAASVPSGVTAAKTMTGTGASMTLDVPDGLYLIVDSMGLPVITGTTVGGLQLTGGAPTLGAVTVKSKLLGVDKKVSHDRNSKTTMIDGQGGSAADTASWSTGSDVTFTITTTLPTAETAKTATLVDTPTGMRDQTATIRLADGTDVTGETTQVNTGTGGALTITFDEAFLAKYGGKVVNATYTAFVTDATRAKAATNKATLTASTWDGKTTSLATSTATDSSAVHAYSVKVKKTNWDGTKTLTGAGFRIQDKDTGLWLARKTDTTSGKEVWNELAGGGVQAAQEFTTGGDGLISLDGLGAGTYHVEETSVPTGMTTLVKASFDLTVADDGTLTVGTEANNLVTGKPGADNDWTVTVRNVDSLTQLPQTGGVAGNMMVGVVLLVTAGGAVWFTHKSRQRLHAHDGLAA